MAETTISKGSYKDVDAVILENDSLRVTVLPEWGSKIQSILYKPSGYEALWQNPDGVYKRTDYSDPYPHGEISGFDEMFPTISECCYEQFPWQGTVLPDHGEVWTIPWKAETVPGGVTMHVYGIRLPYLLSKTLTLDGPGVRIDYRAENLSPFPLSFLWAAHPLFNAAEGMEFIIPRGMDSIINAFPGSRLPAYGGSYGFPRAEVEGKEPFDLSRVPPQNPEGYQKYYFAGKVTEGWCALYRQDTGFAITMAYPKETVPYLGMWLNEGGWAGQYNIAPEPATAAMDRPDAAALWGTASRLEPREIRSWHLFIRFSTGKRPVSVSEDGRII